MADLIYKSDLLADYQQDLCGHIPCHECPFLVPNGHGSTECSLERYISEQPTVDAESLITKHEDIGFEKGYRDGYAEALDATDDAVPVVRCKECKHRISNPHGYTCKRLFKEVNLDHYCSWGERREG